MNKPRTVSEAVLLAWELAAWGVLGLTGLIVVDSLENPGSWSGSAPVLVSLHLVFTLPVLLFYGGRLLWAELLWNRERQPNELVIGETARRPALPVLLTGAEREGHVGIFGATRSGKSTLAEAMAVQDIRNDRHTIVIDPHASVAETLATHSITLGKVPCLLQASDTHITSLNLLQTGPGYSAFDAARTVAEGLSNVYLPFQEELPVRLRNVLETAAYFLAAADQGYTLLELPRYILQPTFREYLARKVAESSLNGDWLEPEHALTVLAWLDSLTPTQLHQQMQSTWTRLAGLLSAPDARRIFGTSKSSFDFEEVLGGSPLLVALQRERLHHGAHLANGMVLTWLTHRLRTRPAGNDGFYSPLFMYLDELAEISPAVFESLLLVAGKRAVRLTFLVQAAAMLNPSLRKSLMANVNALFVLRSSGEGIQELAEAIFVPPTFDAEAAFGGNPTTRQQQVFDLANRIRSLPQFSYLFRSAHRPNHLISGRATLEHRVSPAIATDARTVTLMRRGMPVQQIDAMIRERFTELNTRFGPLQSYGNDKLVRALAPW